MKFDTKIKIITCIYSFKNITLQRTSRTVTRNWRSSRWSSFWNIYIRLSLSYNVFSFSINRRHITTSLNYWWHADCSSSLQIWSLPWRLCSVEQKERLRPFGDKPNEFSDPQSPLHFFMFLCSFSLDFAHAFVSKSKYLKLKLFYHISRRNVFEYIKPIKI